MSKTEIDQSGISIIENFILSNSPKDEICISPKDRKFQIDAYNLINKDTNNTLYLFGSSGYRTYYYYKSNNNQIYLLEVYLDKLDAYSLEK